MTIRGNQDRPPLAHTWAECNLCQLKGNLLQQLVVERKIKKTTPGKPKKNDKCRLPLRGREESAPGLSAASRTSAKIDSSAPSAQRSSVREIRECAHKSFDARKGQLLTRGYESWTILKRTTSSVVPDNVGRARQLHWRQNGSLNCRKSWENCWLGVKFFIFHVTRCRMELWVVPTVCRFEGTLVRGIVGKDLKQLKDWFLYSLQIFERNRACLGLYKL